MKIKIYRNLHKDCYSVLHKGKVVSHEQIVFIKNAKFTVQPAGRERVRREKIKNVHAFISGEWLHSGITKGYKMTHVTYNPYQYETFVTVENKNPVHSADLVFCSLEGVFILS